MVTEQELGWLAGLFDGEGCITTFGGPVGKSKKRVRVDIANSDEELIKKAQTILDNLEIDSYITITRNQTPYLPVYHLQVQSGNSVRKFFIKVPIQSKQKLQKYEQLKVFLPFHSSENTKTRRQRLARQYPSLL